MWNSIYKLNSSRHHTSCYSNFNFEQLFLLGTDNCDVMLWWFSIQFSPRHDCPASGSCQIKTDLAALILHCRVPDLNSLLQALVVFGHLDSFITSSNISWRIQLIRLIQMTNRIPSSRLSLISKLIGLIQMTNQTRWGRSTLQIMRLRVTFINFQINLKWS